MGLFKKSLTEKKWTDVIKNEGSNDKLINKFSCEDFHVNSTLIVMPGESAVFVNGGVIEQIFRNGTYKLTTQNYPFITRLRNYFSGGVSVFNAVVYFIKIAHSIEILWGTTSPIQVRDKILGIATKLRARGSYKVQISEPGLFLGKLLGNNFEYKEQQEVIDEYFSNEFQGKIKLSITRAINEMNIELLGIESHLDEFEALIEPLLSESLSDYGLKLQKFSIGALDIDQDELRRKYDEIGMDTIRKMRNAQADKAVMNTLGEDWSRQKSVDILEKTASNPSGIGGISAGIGLGVATGSIVGDLSKKAFSSVIDENKENADPVATLKKLKEMLDMGLIDQTEYTSKKVEILKKM